MLGKSLEEVLLVLAVQAFPQAVPRGDQILLGEVVDHEVEVVQVVAYIVRPCREDDVYLEGKKRANRAQAPARTHVWHTKA